MLLKIIYEIKKIGFAFKSNEIYSAIHAKNYIYWIRSLSKSN